ncbi:MAG: SMP-30/gluconolactonase/LRE family protein, partial [Kiritimatiellia bacterium]
MLGGSNPPPPPLKPGLKQELVWDGKGDWHLPAGPGPFRVRVRLGMGVRFGKTVGDSPYNFNETVCRGLAVNPKTGDLYVLSKKTRDAALYFLRVYDRQGNYLREIMPYAATVDEKSREAFGFVNVPGAEGPAPMNYHSLWPTFYPVAHRATGVNDLAIKLIAVHPAEESVVLLAEAFDSLYRIRKSDGGAVAATFAEPLWSGRSLAGYAAVGPVMGAFAPDGKTIYFAGYAGVPRKGEARHPNWPDGRVYRTTLTAEGFSSAPFADIPLPEGTPLPERSWNVLGNKQALHGIAVDKSGRVYVCDAAGGKVHILSSAGKILGTVLAPDAYCVAVDDARETIYVLTRKNTGYGRWPKSLVKLRGRDTSTTVVWTLTFPERGGSSDPFLAGDFGGAEPQLWVGGCPRECSILRVADRGDRFEIVEDLADRDKTAAGFACRLDVDREADLVYVHNGWAWIYRYNGVTGEYAGEVDKDGRPKPIIGSEFCIRRDGVIYLSGSDNPGGGYSGPWWRLTRDLKELPLPDGRKLFADRYGKMGGGYFGNQGSFVMPDGHLYFNSMFIFRINAIWEVNPDGMPGRCPRLRDVFENHHKTTVKSEKISETMVKAGFDGALIGWLQDQSGGVELDQQGNIYVGVRILPRGYA